MHRHARRVPHSCTAPAVLLLAPLVLASVGAVELRAQPAPRQTDADAYTRYELLAPGTAQFRIIYDVSATAAGAQFYFNPIRPGSVATDESVFDRATGQPLVFEEVDAATALVDGMRSANAAQRYIRVRLARAVPDNGGEQRIRIVKTYQDTSSYLMRGDTLVFSRLLGIKRNAVVLPQGYELASSTYPAQVLQEPDGRIGISFWNNTPAQAPVLLRAVPTARAATTSAHDPVTSSVADRLDERARQDREIVYELHQPETHAFDLYHDYTETRPGTFMYLNVVRGGSRVSNPSARNLDSGQRVPWRLLTGDEITNAKLDVPDVTSTTEVVVFRFPPVAEGASIRLRMSETYTDSLRYRLVNDELVWDRSFGRPANIVVLPEGWVLTNSAIPAAVTTRPDGRVQLEFINPRPDQLSTLITARRR